MWNYPTYRGLNKTPFATGFLPTLLRDKWCSPLKSSTERIFPPIWQRWNDDFSKWTFPKARPILPGVNVLEFRGRTRPTSHNHTVDGKNHAPADMVNFPLLTGFHTCQVVSRISEPSAVVQWCPRGPWKIRCLSPKYVFSTEPWLVGFEKYESKMGIFPNFRGENRKYLKPPPRWLLEKQWL